MTEKTGRMTTIEDFEEVKQRSLWLDALDRLIRNKAALFGLFICTVIMFTAIFGSYLAPKDYLRTDIYRIAEGPTRDFLLGTDLVGRDVLSRLMHGARTAVLNVSPPQERAAGIKVESVDELVDKLRNEAKVIE